MSELFVPDRPLHAVVGVELFDARTGRKVDESVGENYITPVGLAHNRWKVRNDYMASMPGSNNLDVEPLNPFNVVWLSDSTAAIDVNSSAPEGIPLAWANKTAYVGSDVYRGSPNSIECEASAASAKWVFDWPTHAGNGTIGSVGWTNNMTTNAFAWTLWAGIGNGGFGYQNLGGFIDLGDGTALTWVDGQAGSVMSIGPTGNVVLTAKDSFGPTAGQIGVNYVGGITSDGTDWYAVGYTSAMIRKFPKPTVKGPVTATSISVPGYTDLRSIAFDGSGNLWVLNASPAKVVQINKVSGAVISEFSLVSGATPTAVWYNSATDQMCVSRGQLGEGYVVPSGTRKSRFICGAGQQVVLPDGSMYGPDGLNYGSWAINHSALNVGSRVLLPSPVVKSSLQTMKLTYTFTYA